MPTKFLIRLGLVLILLSSSSPTVYAYTPPPATNILLFQRQIRIQLPPALIMTPNELLFPDYVGRNVIFTFDGTRFNRQSGNGFDKYRVGITARNNGAGKYYVITISGFGRGELPDIKDFRLTFRPTVLKKDIEDLKDYLANPSNPILRTAWLSGPNCGGGGTSHICLKTITTVRVPIKSLTANLFQTISLKGIIVSGNSAALNGTLDGFIQSGTPLAVGRSIGTVEGGQIIRGYDDSSSPINWTNIGSKLIEQFDSNKSYNKNEVTIYDNTSWNLNASDRFNPSAPDKNTFSAPPEGRLWNIYADPSKPQNHWRNDFYNIGKNKNIGTLFSGAGTVSVRRTGTEGPMPVTIHGGVPCASGTRFALITKGDIVFDVPADGELKIDCGAYISLDGNIIFGNNDIKKGTVTGIFVARGNILLPNPNLLTDTFNINPDTNILKDPPVLLRELLKIVFGSSS